MAIDYEAIISRCACAGLQVTDDAAEAIRALLTEKVCDGACGAPAGTGYGRYDFINKNWSLVKPKFCFWCGGKVRP